MSKTKIKGSLHKRKNHTTLKIIDKQRAYLFSSTNKFIREKSSKTKIKDENPSSKSTRQTRTKVNTTPKVFYKKNKKSNKILCKE